MSVSTLFTTAGPYTIGAGTDYTFAFKYFETSDINVRVVQSDGTEIDLVETTNYSVSSDNNDPSAGGTVTLVEATRAAYVGDELFIWRSLPLTQSTDFPTNGDLNEPALTAAIDRPVMIAQEQARDLTQRSLLVPVQETGLYDMEIPNKATRASQYLAFDSDGEPIASPGPSSVAVTAAAATLLDDATISDILTTLGFSAFAKTIIDDADGAAVFATIVASATAAALRAQLGTMWSEVVTLADVDGSAADYPGAYTVVMVLDAPYKEDGVRARCLVSMPLLTNGSDSLRMWVPLELVFPHDTASDTTNIFIDDGQSLLAATGDWSLGAFPTGLNNVIVSSGAAGTLGAAPSWGNAFVDNTITITASSNITVRGVAVFRVAPDSSADIFRLTMTTALNGEGGLAGLIPENLYINGGTVKLIGDVKQIQLAKTINNINVVSGSLDLNGFDFIIAGPDDATAVGTILVATGQTFVNDNGGTLVIRGRHAINDVDGTNNFGDVTLEDLNGNTYVQQSTNITVETLTIGTGCEWDQNGHTLTYTTLVNNGTLTP